MSDDTNAYSFLPWLRLGIGNLIVSGSSEKGRGMIDVQLSLGGRGIPGCPDIAGPPVVRPVALYGPGDVVGIDHRCIVRTEPRNWITNFEPNYLASIEFYDEDLPWRYTPLAADAKGRLTPWIALIVCEERENDKEFEDGQDMRGKPLPYIEVKKTEVFPPADELWAWAHVHVDRGLAAAIVPGDMAAVLSGLATALGENADVAYSRLLCPRKLGENRAYHAFLIPAFESGRRAGLGLDPYDGLPAVDTCAWQADRTDTRYPYYYRWYFRTGGAGDFESLVRLLKPQKVDHRVGRRDIDVQSPGPGIHGLQKDRSELGGILRLGGALQVPEADLTKDERTEKDKYEKWAQPPPPQIQQDIAARVNLADDYAAEAANQPNKAAGITDPEDPGKGDPDPVVTPPLYGGWHAMTKRLLVDRDGNDLPFRMNWVHELNLDPRFRVAAGFGTRVVQKEQEKYMDAAWSQIGKINQVLEAKRFILIGQLAVGTSAILFDRHLRPLLAASPEHLLALAAPLNKRVLYQGATVHNQLTESRLQPAVVSPAMRRIMRPRARLVKRLLFTKERPARQLATRVNAGEVSAVRPVMKRPGFMTIQDAGGAIKREAGAGPAVMFGSPPEAINAIRRSPDFRITETGSGFRSKGGTADSLEARRFKDALKDVSLLITHAQEAAQRPPKKKLALADLSDRMIAGIDPRKTIPARLRSVMVVPPRMLAFMGDALVEPMVYPEFDTPMYEELRDISSELLLPNINLIPNNSITLLESNNKFIEAYMAGLNHEFGRELLWREYPTDQRGSYFRQFWDVSGYGETGGPGDDALKEQLRDIPPLDRWLPSSTLGSHNHREPADGGKANVVLVIRGELLKRYPTAVIYAQHAQWGVINGQVSRLAKRTLDKPTESEKNDPPPTKVRKPLFDAKVDPDIYFFGFDLTADEARGSTSPEDPNPGWFFVIQECPGEPRFGLDIDKSQKLNVWNDLSWLDVQPGEAGSHIDLDGAVGPFPLTQPSSDSEKATQYGDDVKVQWDVAGMTSAELAYILFQAPVLVAVHASEMLGPAKEALGQAHQEAQKLLDEYHAKKK